MMEETLSCRHDVVEIKVALETEDLQRQNISGIFYFELPLQSSNQCPLSFIVLGNASLLAAFIHSE